MAMMDTIEAIKIKVDKLERKIDDLANKFNEAQSIDSSNKTEFKYIKILLSLSLVANGYIGAKLGIPHL